MNVIQIDFPNLTTSEIVQAAYENRLYCGLTNISSYVYDVWQNASEDLWSDEYENGFRLNDISLGGID